MPDTATSDKRQPTAYVVLYLNKVFTTAKDGEATLLTDWETRRVEARSAKEARELAALARAAGGLDEEGVYIAVPERSWQPHQRTVTTREVHSERPLEVASPAASAP